MYIPEEQAAHIIRAVEHYAAYLKATKRDGSPYCELAESLKRKPPVPEQQVRVSRQQVKRKRGRARGANAARDAAAKLGDHASTAAPRVQRKRP
jgi:hypothetical protein